MRTKTEYVKTQNQKSPRPHKVTSVNLEFYQVKTAADEKINLSLVIRDLLDEFLSKNFPVSYQKNKKSSEE